MFIKLSLRWLYLVGIAVAGALCLVGGVVWLVHNLPEDPNNSATLAYGMAFVFAGGALMARAGQLFRPLKAQSERRYRLLRAIQNHEFYR
jgi:drug/metabolite transporter (DMT)-like permease